MHPDSLRDAVDAIGALVQDLDDAKARLEKAYAENARLRLELAEARDRQSIAELAFAYVDAPDGSDDIEQAWYELKGAVEHWRAVEARNAD